MKYGQCIGSETSDVEFKLCSLYLDREFSFDECVEYLKTGRWVFNSSIRNTLSIYLKKYLAKYVASFTNKMTISKSKFASFFIGVDDKGIVNGIPYKGHMNIGFLNSIIENIFNKSLSFSSDDLKDEIRSGIKVKLINVKFNKDINSEKDMYSTFETMYEKQKSDCDRHKRTREFWANIMRAQNGKLSDMINEDRTTFIESDFYSEHISRKKYRHTHSHLFYLCDVPDYYDLVVSKRIKKFNPINDETIKQFKNITEDEKSLIPPSQYNDVIILHTLARYKDHTTAVFRNFKIKKAPKCRPYENLPQFLITQSHNMIPTWLKNNDDMKLYVLKITIPIAVLKGQVFLFNEKKRKYETCYRKEDGANGPITITV